MEWNDEGIVLASRRHGESAAVVSALTRAHGRHAGLVRGGSGKRARSAIQPGNRLQLTWKARLAEQLGAFTWELLAPDGARWLADGRRLAAVASACAVAERALPEREAHPAAYQGLADLLAALAGADWPSVYVRWELALLAELGYGLDLSRCASTGSADDLIYVSPRSGQAVSRAAGDPYKSRLLALPEFLRTGGAGSAADVAAGLTLTGHFLERQVFGAIGKPVPAARTRLVAALRA